MTYTGSHAKPRTTRYDYWYALRIAIVGGTGLVLAGVAAWLLVMAFSGPGVQSNAHKAVHSATAIDQGAKPDIARVPKTAPKAPAAPPVKTYTVRAGDSLWSVAAKEMGSGADEGRLASLNHLSAPYTLQAGQVLKL